MPCSTWRPRRNHRLAPPTAGAGVRAAAASTVVDWTWREACWLGLVGLGAVSAFAELPLQPEQPMPERLRTLFPETVDRIVIQADLTAVAPGPLAYARGPGPAAARRSGIARWRRRLPVQRGVAAPGLRCRLVRRRRSPLARRAPLHRRTAAAGSTWSTTCQRQHGSIRVGPAGVYVRVADEAQVAALLTHPDAARFGLREIAPGSWSPPSRTVELVGLLHRIGTDPAVEDASGTIVSAPAAQRVSRQRPRSGRGRTSGRRDRRGAAGRRTGASPLRRPPIAGSVTEDDAGPAAAGHAGRRWPYGSVYVSADGRPTERELRSARPEAGVGRAPSTGQRPGRSRFRWRASRRSIPAPSGP